MLLAILGVVVALGLVGLRIYRVNQRAKEDAAERAAIDNALQGVKSMSEKS